MKEKGFTLIELLVVTSIIIIITTSGTIYFFKFLDSTSIKSNIWSIKDNIDSFDIKVKDYKIFDYELVFNSWSLWYTYKINNFDIPYYQNLTLDFNTWTWIIKTNVNSTGAIRLLKIYKKNKLFIERVLDSNDVYTWSFNDSSSYKIKWTLSWETLNEIGIKYYIEDNIIKWSNNSLTLDLISKDSDKMHKCSYLKIKNIWWKKSIYCWPDITNKISQAYMFFSQNTVEQFIEIK